MVNDVQTLRSSIAEGRGHFKLIANAMPQFVWSAEPDGTVDFFNDRWVAYTGLTVEGMRREGVKGVVHPEELELTWERWRAALVTGQPYEIEYRLRNAADGSYRWFLARAMPVRDANGNIELWIGTATDIDEQRRAREGSEFVIEAADTLTGFLQAQDICDAFAALAVKRFADWCFITLFEEPDVFTTVSIAHKDPRRRQELEAFRINRLFGKRADGDARPFRAGPTLVERVSDADIRAAAANEEHYRVIKGLRMRSLMTVPLMTPGGEFFGVATFVSAESHRVFNQADLSAAQQAAARAAAALHTAKVVDEERRTSARLRFIAKVSQMLFQSLDLSETFQRVVELICSEVADFAAIALIEDEALRINAIAHAQPGMASVVAALRGQRALQPEAEEALKALLASNDATVRERFDADEALRAVMPYLRSELRRLKPQSAIAVPLRYRGVTYGGLFACYADSGRAYESRDLPVFQEIGHRASIAIENAQSFQRERKIAATLQRASLPPVLPAPQGMRFEGVYSPAGHEGEIGGDWYDVIELDDGAVMISVGDVAGRGLEAAVIMGKVRQSIAVLPRHLRDPARILDAADWLLVRRYPDALVTAFVGIVSADRKTLRYASAGHPYPLIRRGPKIIELRSDGLPLGSRTYAPRQKSRRVTLTTEDLLVLFTDGLIEWNRDYIRGESVLRSTLLSDAVLHAHRPARLIHDVCLSHGSQDDVAILAVSFAQAHDWRFEAENERAAHDARAAFVSYLSRHINDPSALATAELVFGELLANAIKHAPGPITAQLHWSNGKPVIHMIDRGPPFEPAGAPPKDPLSETGRGLFLVHRANAEIRVERLDDYGNHVIAQLPIQGS